MNVGFFGGTFDPVHNGHLAIAEACLSCGMLDRLMIIPAGTTVHKPAENVSSAGMRYAMCWLAFAGYVSVEVLKDEVLRESGSYTIDTIRTLKSRLNSEDELYMVCGADILFDILKWKFPLDILRETSILASLRPGHDPASFEARAEFLRSEHGAKIVFFHARQVEVSSTEVRNAVEASQDIRTMVPEAVARFILDTGLYSAFDPLGGLASVQIETLRNKERVLLGLLDGQRLAHSLVTMTTAARLAMRHHTDVYSAALAGLVHDCAKALPRETACRFVLPDDQATLMEPRLYHGPAGAALAEEKLGISDPDILSAIRYHATGHEAMSMLDLIVYLADKGEPSRQYPEAEKILRLAEEDLEAAFCLSVTIFADYLEGKGKPVHPDTLAAVREIERRNT